MVEVPFVLLQCSTPPPPMVYKMLLLNFRATNPSSFSLELYVNNLNRPNAATFEKLGM